MANPPELVAEMQGLYGPFTIAERVVQKIWLRGDFNQGHAMLTDGRTLRIRSSGRWNLLGGPDFQSAKLIFGDEEITADVEVHFHTADWRAHRHAEDRAYDGVGLHVVMFPPAPGEQPAIGSDGREIPTLVLLPLLHRDLEEYASDDALEGITARDEWERFAELAATPQMELVRLLQNHAAGRWRQKVRFAKLRIAKLGWHEAAHHTALEILGYQRNRAPMLSLAARFPLSAWVAGLDVSDIFWTEDLSWQTQGVRPANHPLARLRQYQRWVHACPDWIERLLPAFEEIIRVNREGVPTEASGERKGATTDSFVVLNGGQDAAKTPATVSDRAKAGARVTSFKIIGAISSEAEAARASGEVARKLTPLFSGSGLPGWVGAPTQSSNGSALEDDFSTTALRKQLGLAAVRGDLVRGLMGGAVGGTRLDNLVCDGFLPLVAAGTGKDLGAVWFHWFLGDVPAPVRQVLPKLGVAGRGAPPHCHGWAQGMLGWILTHEARASG